MEKIVKADQLNIDDLLNESQTVVESAPSKLIISDNESIGKITEKPKADEKKEYTGPGIVIEKPSMNEKLKDATIGGVTSDTRGLVDKYIKDMNEEIEENKKVKAKMEEKGITPEMLRQAKGAKLTPEDIERFRAEQDPGKRVTIIINKSDVGKIEWTPEQEKILERASKIIIEEQETVKYSTIKIRKSDLEKKKDRMHIIDKAFDKTLSPFIALGSGYMGKMGNCSTMDIMRLGRAMDAGNNLASIEERWQLLYDKMKYCSIGKFKSFDDFLKGTAFDDYDNLQFALITASLPANTTLSFTCPNCKKSFTKDFKNQEFLRTELINDEMAEYAKDILTSDTFEERAKEVYENAPFNKVTRVSVVDDDSILLDVYAPSAYDAIYRIYKGLESEKLESEDYRPYVSLLRLIKTAYLAVDIDETGEPIYEDFDDPDDILEILARFNENQIDKLSAYIGETYLSHKYYYGVKDVICPDCGHNLGDFTMTMDNLLFLKVRPPQAQ